MNTTAVMNLPQPVGLWGRFRKSGAGKSVMRLARRAIDATVETYLRIDTTGITADRGGGVHGDSNHYEPLDYPLLRTCVKALDLRPDDVVYEIGCGMGRPLALFARRRIAKCIGIELSAELAARASENMRTLRGVRAGAVDVKASDAVLVDYSDGTAFYIFNSFGPTTLAAVLERIRSSTVQRPRRVRIIYVNPLHEDVFESSGWLRRTKRVQSRLFRMQGSIWVNEL